MKPSLPELRWEDFYRRPRFEGESLILDYELDATHPHLVIRTIPSDADHPPDHHQILHWDGYGYTNQTMRNE